MRWVLKVGGEGVLAFFLCYVLLAGQTESLQAPGDTMGLTKEDIYFLFGDEEEPPSHSLVNVRSRSRERRSTPSLTHDPGLLDVTLEDEGQEIEFELHLNPDLVSPDFLLVVRDGDEVTEERGLGRPSCLYYGTAKGRPDISAALSNCDGQGFTGVIMSGNESQLLRPLQPHKRQRRQTNLGDDLTPDGLHVIHNRREGAKCGVFDIKAMTAPRLVVKLNSGEDETNDDDDDENEMREQHNVKKREAEREESEHRMGMDEVGKEEKKREQHNVEKREVGKDQIETAVFVDDELYKVINKANPNKNTEETVKDLVFTIMNGVHMLYNAPSLDLHFTITLVRVDIVKNSTRGPSKADGDIQRYLTSFCVWQQDLNKKTQIGETWDHALMLSGLNLYDGFPKVYSVIGLAWVSGMCHPLYSCTINEGTSFESVYVIAHEMGHNLGMSHDGSKGGNQCEGDKFLMSASTGPGKVTWSTCSNQELKSFLKSGKGCLKFRDRGPRKLEFESDNLPGEKFTQERQCTFAEGSNFKPYVTSKQPYNSVCRELWCQNTTHALRIHPALEGTTCGLKKCVAKTTSTTTTKPSTNAPPTKAPRKEEESSGLSNIFRRIRDLFRRYLSLRSDVATNVFTSRWRQTPVTSCSAECGGGWKEEIVTCMGAEGRVPMADNLCDMHSRPPTKTACNTSPCITLIGSQGLAFPGN
ncbi:hypothetical protein Pmani_033612 [Petrolisthes manimaculis]|uniref:Peptidase M12B domain-containing protein n=1 Tax=Petrolisthes manimaculis TaxID=1843537 RepID=A0AAE1NQP5_9EUCA|nr:hypothetical protein Pmani_033612 [Petrolisthes manimaculis]